MNTYSLSQLDESMLSCQVSEINALATSTATALDAGSLVSTWGHPNNSGSTGHFNKTSLILMNKPALETHSIPSTNSRHALQLCIITGNRESSILPLTRSVLVNNIILDIWRTPIRLKFSELLLYIVQNNLELITI